MLAMIGMSPIAILFLIAVFGILVIGTVALVIILITRSGRQKPPQTQSFTVGTPPPRDLEQELRMLAKLRDERVITEEDFNSKKKALLGI